MSRRLISSDSPFESQIGYSRAVISGPWVFVSGTTGYVFHNPSCYPIILLVITTLLDNKNRYDYSTSQISPDVAQQCDQALKNIHAALQEAGADMKDVVRVRYLLPDRGDFKACWPVLQKWLGDVRPAATMCQAGLMEEVMKIEVEVTAHVLE